ncbi:hypothetical protein HYT17_03695 [Candidatus Microgenomates bacterium]|nr:hypothetical protein [Candidatus Microgenomates bacterium]
MEKSFPLKWILIIVLAILFVPIPFYVGSDKAVCLGIDICPKQGWNFGPSLWQKISAPKKPNSLPSNAVDKFCGGIANIACPSGYTCKLDGSYPDSGGKCIKN